MSYGGNVRLGQLMDSRYQYLTSGGATYAGGFPYTNMVSTGSYSWQSSTGMQLSVGTIVEDLGDWIKTTAGELLRVVVDEFGRRVVQKTGEILSRTPVGPATAGAYAGQVAAEYWPMILAGGLLLILLLRR